MSENSENANTISNEEVKVNETVAEAVKSEEVVIESAGEMVADEEPILKEKKEKRRRMKHLQQLRQQQPYRLKILTGRPMSVTDFR